MSCEKVCKVPKIGSMTTAGGGHRKRKTVERAPEEPALRTYTGYILLPKREGGISEAEPPASKLSGLERAGNAVYVKIGATCSAKAVMRGRRKKVGSTTYWGQNLSSVSVVGR